jgi:DNA-binding protein HU-beta
MASRPELKANCPASSKSECRGLFRGGRIKEYQQVEEEAFPNNLNVLRGGKKMTKAELVAKIAGDGGITKAQAEKAVDGFVSAVSSALAGGDKITLVGFGTFSVGSRSQREGRNPRTGEKIKIPASKVVKFKAGKTLSEKVK